MLHSTVHLGAPSMVRLRCGASSRRKPRGAAALRNLRLLPPECQCNLNMLGHSIKLTVASQNHRTTTIVDVLLVAGSPSPAPPCSWGDPCQHSHCRDLCFLLAGAACAFLQSLHVNASGSSVTSYPRHFGWYLFAKTRQSTAAPMPMCAGADVWHNCRYQC